MAQANFSPHRISPFLAVGRQKKSMNSENQENLKIIPERFSLQNKKITKINNVYRKQVGKSMQNEDNLKANTITHNAPQFNLMTNNLIINFKCNKEKSMINNMKREFKRQKRGETPAADAHCSEKVGHITVRNSIQSTDMKHDTFSNNSKKEVPPLAVAEPRNIFSGGNQIRKDMNAQNSRELAYGLLP